MPAPKTPKTLASREYLMRIEDPAIRSIMQSIIAERDKLNVLKANTQVTVDRRQLGTTVAAAPGSQPVAVLVMAAQFTASEFEALQKAASADFLEARGLREGGHGEIVNARGRTVFEVGFARAIRNVLAWAKQKLKEKNMSVAYYLACIESVQYVWVGAPGPDFRAMPEGNAGAISRFALTHRSKPLVVVCDTHPILDDGKEWEVSSGT